MHDLSTLFIRTHNSSTEIVERLDLGAATIVTDRQRRLAYSKLLSIELTRPTSVVLNPVAVVIRQGCLCTPEQIGTQECVLAYIDSNVRARLRARVEGEHTLERYREKITVW